MSGPGGIDVLLVEDTPGDVEMTLRAFRERGLGDRVHLVEDGQQALDFVFSEKAYSGRSAENPPKLVLLDLSLPKVGGLEVVRRLKSDPRTMMIPVVILTSSDETRDVVESYRLGANSYVTKPIQFEEYVAVVGHLSLYWLKLNRPAK